MRVEIGYLQTCSAVIVVLATIMAREVDSRLPPKLLKVASGAGKALYARGYGYSVIPIPQKILLQTNVARREVHHPRPTRRAKRPRRNKRPPPAPYAAKYQDYRPSRKRRPPPSYNREPDYLEQENDEDFEYQEFEDFVAKHSELYADGYNSRGKPPRNRFKDEDGAFSENSGFVYRRQRPTRSGRPSTKLYSAAIALPSRYRDESDYDEEDEDDYNRDTYDRGRYREDDEEDDRYYQRDRYRDWNPDDVYHDRTYETKQEKFRRAAEEKPITKNVRKPQVERIKKPKTNIIPDRPIWPQDNQNKWKTPNERNRFQNRNRLKQLFTQEDQMKWKEPEFESSRLQPTRLDPVRPEQIELGDQGRWRNSESLGIGKLFGKEPNDGEEWKEPEIITKQNAARWEQKGKRGEMKDDSDGWVKEHSVGYGIEIDGGGRKKKVEHAEPDVVYGQSVYSKPRVPDLGYGQGMELANDKVTGWQVYLRLFIQRAVLAYKYGGYKSLSMASLGKDVKRWPRVLFKDPYLYYTWKG